jgi:deoxyribose-phosphate aldolase
MSPGNADRDKLVDLITDRVMEELKRARAGAAKETASAPRPSAPPPAPAPADAGADAETRERMRLFTVTGGAKNPEETRTLHEAGAARVGATMGYCPASDGLASLIDHTLLKPDAAQEEIELICREALQFCFASVCVNPNWVPLCASMLKGSGVKVCTVIGFPFGSHLPDVKAYEARRAVEQGADEVDMVINIGALKSKDYALVEQDIRGVVQAVGKDTVVKVILETALLNRDEKVMGSSLAKAAGADFVKTSTGFGGGGATVEDIRLMRETVGPEMGVKASGGVRTSEDVQKMVQAGATRIGASASVKIVRGEAGGAPPPELPGPAQGSRAY